MASSGKTPQKKVGLLDGKKIYHMVIALFSLVMFSLIFV
jgi:hypothetical protein